MSVLTPPRGTRTVPSGGPGGRALERGLPVPSTVRPLTPHPPGVAPLGPDPRMSRPTDRSSDPELVELARRGDRGAFDELLRRHDDRMRGLAYRLLADRHAMDDALQEAYVNAYRGLARFKAGSNFGTWLYRITYNACIDEIRRRKRRPVADEDAGEGASGRPGPERVVSAAETVRAALAELPVSQRVTVVLVDGEGFDHQEVAKILGVAPGTVASRLHRARAALRRTLGEEVG